MTQSFTLNEAPFAYIERGFPVFPLNGKRPYEAGGFKTASLERAQIERWLALYPDCNWGVPTGAASGFDVLDIDGPIGIESLTAWENSFDSLPHTPVQQTGSGGYHFLFAASGIVRNSAKAMAPGWDTRGDGGYIVVAPSIHPDTGQAYQWLKDPWETPLAPWPDALLDRYQQAQRNRLKNDGIIELGTQENELTRLTGVMLRQGFSKSETLEAIQKVADERCDPPVLPTDVRRIVDSIYNNIPGDPLLTTEFTDRGWGLRFHQFAGKRVRYVTSSKSWAVWSGKVWEMGADLDAWLVFDDLVDTMIAKTEALPETTDAEKEFKATAVPWAMAGRRARTQEVALRQAQRFSRIKADQFDTKPWLFTCENGTIDLESGVLRPHESSELITRKSPVIYDPKAKSELWEWFLKQTTGGDEELARYIQRVVGYTMTGEISEQLLMVIYGPTGSGKSTFVNAIESIFGTYAQKLSNGTLILKRDPDGASPGIAKLAGARLVSGVEIDKGRRLDESLIKSLTGNEQISTRTLYEAEFTFTPQFTIWLATNDSPIISASESIFRRIKRVPFDHAVPAEERDRSINDQLHAMEEHQRAILAWAVEGCLAWQREGIGSASAVEQSTADYKEDMSTVQDFIDVVCLKVHDGWVDRDQLFLMYQAFKRTRGLDVPGHNRHFFGDMRDAGYRETRRTIEGRQRRGFGGLEIKPQYKDGDGTPFDKLLS